MPSSALTQTAEYQRLTSEAAARWRHWGPYLAERAWGTVREDYSAEGDAWGSFPHDHARSRAYRWNEDGLAGFCDEDQYLCLGLALWNEHDPFLKERLYGLHGLEGNHGEDVKEYYYFLDALPSHAYQRMLYRYPHAAFPYQQLIDENRRRTKEHHEYELVDALGADFLRGCFTDVVVEYGKASPDDILCRITATNRGPTAVPLHVLPQVWFRNTWAWDEAVPKPRLDIAGPAVVEIEHLALGNRWWYVDAADAQLLTTENETNTERLYGRPNRQPYVKDGIHEAVVHGQTDRVHPDGTGTKAAAHIRRDLPPGGRVVVRVRLSDASLAAPFDDFDEHLRRLRAEADAFYAAHHPDALADDERRIQRQAFAGLLWTKQFYHFDVDQWLAGDPTGPSVHRHIVRNRDWRHLNNRDVLSMPDTWEYPWYAAWDLAFHMIPLALIDAAWAKTQLLLLLREWYMHPNGQIPAYEWNFSDVNPPVHAWACWRVFQIDARISGTPDYDFLERAFHKLLLNFTFWVNRKDAQGNNIFEGGFLGLDNIGVFDRSKPLPTGGYLEQADGTAWMGLYCLTMLSISLELATQRPAYEDVATKFFEHFIYIAHAINNACGGQGLWHDEDGFYYDMLMMPDGEQLPMRVRSFVGLAPLYAVTTIDAEVLDALPGFRRRMQWFLEHRPDLVRHIASLTRPGQQGRRILTLVSRRKLERMLERMLDPAQFLSPYGLRSLSKEHADAPFVLHVGPEPHVVGYEPAESRSYLFGGNSNWRGPVWFPINYLLIEALQQYHHYWGDDLTVEHPAGSGSSHPLDAVAADLSDRLIDLFRRNGDGRRPVFGGLDLFQEDPLWRDHLLFYEYFHGDNGAGIGASHQTGWTALVAKLLQQRGDYR